MAVLGQKYYSPQSAPQRQLTTWERVKGAGARTLANIGDVLSRSSYAVNNLYNDAVKSVQGKQFNANPLSSLYEGFSGRKKTTFEDVLKTANVGEMGKVKVPIINKDITGRNVLGFAGDVLLDPTTYLTAGTGTGAKIAVKQGGKQTVKTLTKAGTREMADIALKQAEKNAAKKVAKGAANKLADVSGERYAAKQIAKKIAEDPTWAAKNVDKGGIQLAGHMIPLTDKAVQPISNAVRGVTGKFGRDAMLGNDLTSKRIFQQARDVENATLATAKQSIYETFRGVNKAERKMITQYLDGTLKALPAKLQEKAMYAKKLLDDLADQESARGILKNTADNYVPHIYKDAQRIQKVTNNFNPGTRFAKERYFKDLNEAIEKAGLTPEYDIEKLLNARVASSTKATLKHDMQKTLAQEVGLPSKKFSTKIEQVAVEKTPETTVTITKRKITAKPNPELAGRDFTAVPGSSATKGMQIPTDVYNYMKTMDQKVFRSPGTQKIIEGYDVVNQFIKASLTSLFPSFHARNAASNVLQNYIDIGLMQSLNPRLHLNAVTVMRANSDNELIKVAGKTWRVGDLKKVMHESGVLTGKGPSEYTGVFDKGLKAGGQIGRRVGTGIENEARAVNFLANMERNGGLITQAAERTKKFLFDYDNLGQTERDILKRVFPFYTWTSKNVALTAEQLIKNPGKYANQFKFARDFSEPISEEEFNLLPEWEKNQFILKTGSDGQTMAYTTGFGTPIEAFADTVGQPGKATLNALTPGAKFVAERALNKDFFTGKDIVNAEDPENSLQNANGLSKSPQWFKDVIRYDNRKKTNPVTGKETQLETAQNTELMHLLNQPPLSRFLAGYKQMEGDGTNASKGLRILTGVNAKSSDLETQQYYKDKEEKAKMALPFTSKQILKEGYGGYYLNKNIEMTQEERDQAKAMLPILNAKTGGYGGTDTGKLNKKEMKIASILASMQGLSPEEQKHAMKAIEYLALGYKEVPKSKGRGKNTNSYVKPPSVSIRKVSSGVKKLGTMKAKKVNIKKVKYAKNR